MAGGVNPETPRKTRLLSSLILAALAVVVLVAAITVFQMMGRSRSGASDVGQPAPDLALPTAGGEVVRLSELRGRWVLLNFRTTTCSYCREETPSLQEASQTLEEVVVLSVYVTESAERVAAYTTALSATYPSLVDADGAAMRAYAVRGVPVSYFIDPDGRISARHLGPLTVESIRGYVGGG